MLILSWLLQTFNANAQKTDHATYDSDTLPHYRVMMDSFSNALDSVNAGKFLLKTDPYIFLFEGIPPDSMGVFLSANYLLRVADREKYVELYRSAYQSPKTAAYRTFELMEKEDQSLRLSNDTLRTTVDNDKIRISDSIHFDYLYKYVRKNGWPSIKNGSLYASIIALHDHEHHEFYLPFIKNAVASGAVNNSILQLMLQWIQSKKNQDQNLYLIKEHKYVRFDVSSLVVNQLPSAEVIAQINITLGKYCPVRTMLAAECNDNQLFVSMTNREDRYILSSFFRELTQNNCNTKEVDAWQQGTWSIHYLHADSPAIKVYFYIIPLDSVISHPARLSQIDSGDDPGIFNSQQIHFDRNKSTLAPKSVRFLSEYAEWLNKHTEIRVEITGHTDNDGTDRNNLRLSRERAQAVKNELVKLGIDRRRIAIKGYGANMPASSNITQKGKADNRRVELIKL
jgi:outer membrane protein OmpA-like peptidoglycan-associated protein